MCKLFDFIFDPSSITKETKMPPTFQDGRVMTYMFAVRIVLGPYQCIEFSGDAIYVFFVCFVIEDF